MWHAAKSSATWSGQSQAWEVGLSVVTGLLLPEACLVERTVQKVTTESSSPRVIASRSKNKTPGLKTEGETQAQSRLTLGLRQPDNVGQSPWPDSPHGG